MRAVALFVFGFASLVSGGASAQDWTSLSMDDLDRDARWNACYKETRLIYRTRNMSEQQYRVAIKDARRVHMRDCMARVAPPRPLTTPDADERKLPSSIAGWAANP